MKEVQDRVVQFSNRYKLTDVDTGTELGTFDFEEVTGTVQQVGTEIDKELFDSIANDLAARVKLSGGELAGTVVTFSDISGTAANVASGDTSATLWGKVKNWFSRLKALAFKNKVAAGDFEAGAIKNADVAADAAIAQGKISGLMTDYVASISVSGRTVTYKNKNGANMGSITTQDTTYGLASQSSNGLMSSTDKTKLDGIESGAQKNTVLGVKGGSESAYRTGNVNITKANIGLGNVDNTSDKDKPISTATQMALSGKANTSGTYPNMTVGKAQGDENGNGLMSHATRNELLNGTQSYDFNDYIEWGHYELQGESGTPLVNAPTSTSNPAATDADWYLDVYRRDSFYVTQIAYSVRSDGAVAIRVCSNNSWGSWRVVIDSGIVPNATNATNATNDGEGNNIKATYAKKNETYPNMTVGKATADEDGNNIKATYAKKNDVGTVVKTATEWQAQNPVLSAGQFGYDTTNEITKVGDGSTLWSALPFLVTTDLSFAKASWKKIAILAENGDARNIFSVGDEKTINLTNGTEVTLVILGFNHDDLTSGGKAGITIGTKELLPTSYYNAMNGSNTNIGGWNDSRMRTSTMATILSQLPNDLQEAIKFVDKKTTKGGKTTSIITSSDKLFLLSEVEIDGTEEDGYTGEGEQYEYWKKIKNGTLEGDRVKYLANGTGGAGIWWLRSPIISNPTAFRCITQSGSYSNLLASNTGAISFAFCM